MAEGAFSPNQSSPRPHSSALSADARSSCYVVDKIVASLACVHGQWRLPSMYAPSSRPERSPSRDLVGIPRVCLKSRTNTRKASCYSIKTQLTMCIVFCFDDIYRLSVDKIERVACIDEIVNSAGRYHLLVCNTATESIALPFGRISFMIMSLDVQFPSS